MSQARSFELVIHGTNVDNPIMGSHGGSFAGSAYMTVVPLFNGCQAHP